MDKRLKAQKIAKFRDIYNKSNTSNKLQPLSDRSFSKLFVFENNRNLAFVLT